MNDQQKGFMITIGLILGCGVFAALAATLISINGLFILPIVIGMLSYVYFQLGDNKK